MDSCIVDIEGIEVVLKKSNRAKKINIKVKPFESVCVSVPKGLTFKRAEEFARQYSDWIVKNSNKIKTHESKAIIFDATTEFKTKNHRLEIIPADIKKLSTRVTQGRIQIKYNPLENLKSPSNQTIIKSAIIKALRIEAKEYLPQRTSELAKIHGLKYRNVTIKNLKSRWGSCSYENNINLNLHLMRLPDELIDYVILHELAHTKQKNHARNFWDYLEKICPNSKALNKQLKNHSIINF